MGYISDLRALVGHQPLLLLGAGALIVDAQGRLLLQRRSDDDTWGIVGGAVEPGESVEEAARREVHEETGLKAESLLLWDMVSGRDCFHTYLSGDQAHIVSIVYFCPDWTGEPIPTEESKELRFFAPAELQGLSSTQMSGVNRAIIQGWLERGDGAQGSKSV